MLSPASGTLEPMMKIRRLLPWFLVPALPLLVPLVAMQFTAEVRWTGSDFVVAYVLLAGAGLAYRLATSKAGSLAYRGAAGLAVAAGLLLIWVNLAVGFIGSEDNPANLLYAGVLAIGLLGAVLARLEPRGMARALYATAGAQFLVPVIAFIVWRPNFDAGVMKIFFLNGFWVLLFTVAAMLFQVAAARQPTRV